MPDFEMCLSETCPASGRCRRHKASGTNPSHMQAYGYHEPGANGRCDVYLPRYEAEFPGWAEALAESSILSRSTIKPLRIPPFLPSCPD